MRLKIPKDVVCGNVTIPRNEYWVSMNTEAGEMLLSAGGKDIRIKATKRRHKVHARTTQISFYCGGGKQWSIIITVPKHGEWVALLETR